MSSGRWTAASYTFSVCVDSESGNGSYYVAGDGSHGKICPQRHIWPFILENPFWPCRIILNGTCCCNVLSLAALGGDAVADMSCCVIRRLSRGRGQSS